MLQFARFICRGRFQMREQSKPKSIPNTARTTDPEKESIWRVFYRYLWPFQYFRDVTRGSLGQQSLSYQYNRSMRFCLPGFMLKWSVLAVLWFAWGAALDGQLSFAIPTAACFVACSLSLIVVVIVGVGWLWLDRFSERF